MLKATKFQVPRRFEGRATFGGALWQMLSAGSRKALAYCEKWVQSPERTPGPLLSGKSGTFKTHLLWATARELHARGANKLKNHADNMRTDVERRIGEGSLQFAHEFQFDMESWPVFNLVATDGAEIAHEVRSSIERRNLDEVVARYRQESSEPSKAALIVDDVEVMKLSDWLHEELYRIFDYRYQQSMPTFVATNLSCEELRRHLGDRIARRILDMTEPFEL